MSEERVSSDTETQLSEALTAQAVANRGASEAQLNRVASLITGAHGKLLDVQESIAALYAVVETLRVEVHALSDELHEMTEKGRHAAQ